MPSKVFPCDLISWSRVDALARQLAFQIMDRGYRPDTLIAIARGGYVPTRILCDFLGVYALTSVRVEHYTEGACRQQYARIKAPLSGEIRGQRVLLVDDVCDTGDTFYVAIQHIQQFQPKEVRTAVLLHKVVASYQPDYFARRVLKWHWLIFPWAVMEDLTAFVRQMENSPKSLNGIAQRLQTDYGLRVSMQRLRDIQRLLHYQNATSNRGRLST